MTALHFLRGLLTYWATAVQGLSGLSYLNSPDSPARAAGSGFRLLDGLRDFRSFGGFFGEPKLPKASRLRGNTCTLCFGFLP